MKREVMRDERGLEEEMGALVSVVSENEDVRVVKAGAEKRSLMRLPDEVLRQVALCVERERDVRELGATCRTLNAIVQQREFVREWSARQGLLERGDVTRNALYRAAMEGDVQRVRHLLRYGFASPRDGFGFALRVACKNGHLQLVRLLLDADDSWDSSSSGGSGSGGGDHVNADDENTPNERRPSGGLLVAIASEYGHYWVVRELLARGCAVDEFDNAALRAACRHGHARIASFLLAQGADPAKPDGLPMRLAVRYRHDMVCALLRGSGARHAGLASD
mmetsp:Transcript_4854/g.13012  ORF Transcript_4854/g.13012 Transcript_4854/m.13012 type:complete len:279 (-) Transcript_4854:120-956(-)|eukprot:CAMPEP_0185835280 /NCGR_PEP_ID=MMETSP1353-20130828/7410_1 /TAXON_ID=1077150 /ORGANISM="Erythrolobus australicus, Strain CCMP3124" /LENGTH=278 /DNA_ID=CAMNT_0028533877 /DNA_START=132 /DNA_END=968 /DNA_ORIENTATION=+